MPAKVRVLFVGESAPAGLTFFYSGNSTLFRQVRKVFDEVEATEGLSSNAFFERFRDLGFYLDDLCLEPINDLPDAERVAQRVAAEPALAARIATYEPEVVIAIGKTTAAPSVQSALLQSGLRARFEVLPFPGRPEHQKAFARDAAGLLHELSRD
jgi:hypothetical protein